MTIKKSDTTEEFVLKYKAALKAKLSREEFSTYLGVKPDTVIRRRLTIKTNTGLDLPYLPIDTKFDGKISVEKSEKFEEYLELLREKNTPIKTEHQNKKGVYVIVSAQNATPIHDGFWATILSYADHRHAEVMVIPYRYANPTSIWTENNKDNEYWWAPITPYLVTKPVKLCEGLQVMGHIKITPTATRPLSGLESMTGMDSGVFGHPKLELKTIATPSKKLPKILTTTGTCTVENYTDSKTGHKGAFHHNLSALVVEVDDDKFHIRHIHAEDDGSFYDLNYYYTPKGRTKYNRIAALVSGDSHAEFMDDKVMHGTYSGPESILEVLYPEVMVFHDVEDFYRRNHHHRNNDILSYGKHHYGRNNVEEGLQITADFLDSVSRPDILKLITRANHDEAFDRWLKEADPKLDPENAKFYYYMKFNQLDNIKPTRTGYQTIDAFEFWCKNPMDQKGLKSIDTTKFLKRDESFVVNGIEIGFHGDIGNNGGRGSIHSYSKIGPKVIIGHSHSPGILEGAYQVGVSAYLDLEYAVGPSSWLHTHCIVYPNGARTLINLINGEWRASYYDKESQLLR
jgi:hypothetical protein